MVCAALRLWLARPRNLKISNLNNYTIFLNSSEMNNHLQNTASTKIIQRELHVANMHGPEDIPKPLVSPQNAIQRRLWCPDHQNRAQMQIEQVIRSDESLFTVSQSSGRVFVWRTTAETFHVDCLFPTVEHEGGSVMVWGAISLRGLV